MHVLVLLDFKYRCRKSFSTVHVVKAQGPALKIIPQTLNRNYSHGIVWSNGYNPSFNVFDPIFFSIWLRSSGGNCTSSPLRSLIPFETLVVGLQKCGKTSGRADRGATPQKQKPTTQNWDKFPLRWKTLDQYRDREQEVEHTTGKNEERELWQNPKTHTHKTSLCHR